WKYCINIFDTPDKVRLGKCNLIEEVIIDEDKLIKFSGAAEMLIAKAVSQLPEKTPGEESIVIELFACALRQLSTIIPDNAGYDSAKLIANLRAAHTSGKSAFGLDMEKGITADMVELGILESFHLKRQVVIRAAKAAEMALCLDNII
ncbi:unnamed protein product, partial [Rotaria sp. Silwood2]